MGLTFSGTNFLEGLGFMVRKSMDAGSAKDLNDVTLCTWRNNHLEDAATEYLKGQGVSFRTRSLPSIPEALRAYDSGRCDVMPLERTGLGAQRNNLNRPNDHVILPDMATELPLGPFVRNNDRQWNDIVRAILNAQIVADEKGLGWKNVDVEPADAQVRHLLSEEGTVCEDLGLSAQCFRNAIRDVGNVSEIFARNVGPGTWMNLDQGLNKPASRGGKLTSFSF